MYKYINIQYIINVKIYKFSNDDDDVLRTCPKISFPRTEHNII